MKKIYKVYLLFADGDKGCELVIAESPREAENKACAIYEEDWMVIRVCVEEVTEIDGFKISINQ